MTNGNPVLGYLRALQLEDTFGPVVHGIITSKRGIGASRKADLR
jgi:hypothetical protein